MCPPKLVLRLILWLPHVSDVFSVRLSYPSSSLWTRAIV